LPAFAGQLTCWNIRAKFGSAPVFKAQFQTNSSLTNVQMLTNEGPFGSYDISDVVSQVAGTEITSTRSPYEGAQEFMLTPDTQIRLILPMDLSPAALKATVLKGGHLPDKLAQRQNGVIDVSGSRHRSGGSIFVRMHCLSRD